MRESRLLLCGLLLFGGSALAQPVVNFAANAASSIDPRLPNGGLNQGGMFVAYGSNLGPAQVVLVDAFPLQGTLGGTTVRITSGGVNFDALMIYTLATQVAAIIPSTVPVGPATLTVSFNNQTSAPFPIQVQRTRFGIFALNQAGSGPGIFTAGADVNTLLAPAEPFSIWVIWGTGLGPVAGDEAGGPLPGDQQQFDVDVFVGGRPAEIFYQGRSGCCAGLDQIAFKLPDDPTLLGCYVPVVVVVDGIPSNVVTMSIAPQGKTCSDDTGFSEADLAIAEDTGALRVGTISMSSVNLRLTPVPPVVLRTDTVAGEFGRYNTALGLTRAQTITGISVIGACTVFRYSGTTPAVSDPAPFEPLEAGSQITITGPGGTRNIPRSAAGSYVAEIGGTQGIPGLPGGSASPIFFTAGVHTITNGAGGAQVGTFSADVAIPPRIAWTNQDTINTVDRAQQVALQWTGADAPFEFVEISGFSTALSSQIGAGFICRERAAAGSFTVPVDVLRALPPSQTQEGVPTGQLAVSAILYRPGFSQAQLDTGLITYRTTEAKLVTYR